MPDSQKLLCCEVFAGLQSHSMNDNKSPPHPRFHRASAARLLFNLLQISNISFLHKLMLKQGCFHCNLKPGRLKIAAVHILNTCLLCNTT